MRGIRKQAHPVRPASANPGDSTGSWSSGPPPARQPEDETRAPATLVDATFHATADAGSIPAVSINACLLPPRGERGHDLALLAALRIVAAVSPTTDIGPP